MTDIDNFIEGYITCALWSSTDSLSEEGEDTPLDEDYGTDDLSKEALDSIREDCADFIEANEAHLIQASEQQSERGDEHHGHDFWLTRNGHGTGFWDRGYTDGVGDALSEAARVYGSSYIYVGDDNQLHIA